MEVLQTSALPLGYGAVGKPRRLYVEYLPQAISKRAQAHCATVLAEGYGKIKYSYHA